MSKFQKIYFTVKIFKLKLGNEYSLVYTLTSLYFINAKIKSILENVE